MKRKTFYPTADNLDSPFCLSCLDCKINRLNYQTKTLQTLNKILLCCFEIEKWGKPDLSPHAIHFTPRTKTLLTTNIKICNMYHDPNELLAVNWCMSRQSTGNIFPSSCKINNIYVEGIQTTKTRRRRRRRSRIKWVINLW